MRVLYMASTPLAGVCEKMARVLNTYGTDEVKARVCNNGPGKHAWYCRPPQDLVPRYSIRNPQHVAECIEWADVIHCMANVGVRSPCFDGFDRQELLKKKRWVYQWHGAQIWPFERVWLPEDYPRVVFIHIGQGWVQTQRDFFQPFIDRYGMREMPNVITGDDKLHTPLPWSKRKEKTAFAPSQHRPDAVNTKGIPETLDGLRGTRYDLISSTQFEVCLKRKAVCMLGIDEVVTPMYHLSGLEFLAQGTPCICSYTEETERGLKQATGSDVMPFLQASAETLAEVVKAYWSTSNRVREQMGIKARAWFDEFYHPRRLIWRYVDEVYSR